ncbi:MAG TPA: hypothetical protein V6C97_33750 [Oculatellaceae cyanobacterium]
MRLDARKKAILTEGLELERLRQERWFRPRLPTPHGLAVRIFDVCYETLLIGFGLPLLPGVHFHRTLLDAFYIGLTLTVLHFLMVPLTRRLYMIACFEAVLSENGPLISHRFLQLMAWCSLMNLVFLVIMSLWPNGLVFTHVWAFLLTWVVLFCANYPTYLFSKCLKKLAPWLADKAREIKPSL